MRPTGTNLYSEDGTKSTQTNRFAPRRSSHSEYCRTADYQGILQKLSLSLDIEEPSYLFSLCRTRSKLSCC